MTATATAPATSAITNETFKQEQAEFDEFVRTLPADCWDEIGGERRPNKSFFRKVGKRFAVDVVVLREESDLVGCNPDVCPKSCAGNHYEVRYTVRATRADTGRHIDGDGSCIDNDKWLPRTKRCFVNQLKSVLKALGRYTQEDAERLVAIVTDDRTTNARHLHPTEAKAVIEFVYGDTPSLEPPIPLRNSRHNVRGTARTRAVNRAISDLIAGGVVSAEESTHTDREADNAAQDAQQDPPAPSPRRTPAATPPAPAAKAPKEISVFQKKRIENHPAYKGLSDIQRGQFISDATGGEACRIDKLTTTTASKVITALDKVQPPQGKERQAHG